MADLIIHSSVDQRLREIRERPPHALLLCGAPGVGKKAISHQLAEQILGVSPGELSAYPYFKLIEAENSKTISIEAIRELEHFLSLKISSQRLIARIIVIVDAHNLTTEAQNALLKTLEEPPANTMLVLTSAHDQALLPTIRSRVQIIAVKRPPYIELVSYLQKDGYSVPEIHQVLAISGGMPGLAQSLLDDDTDHPLVQAAETARVLLRTSTYERLLLVDELAKQREGCQNIMFILEQMAHAALTKSDTTTSKRWQSVLTAAYYAREQLLASAQPKLVLTNFMLNL